MGNKPCCFCYPDTPMNYFQRKEEQRDVGNTEFTEKAKKLVREYTADHLDKADEPPAFDVFVVWNAYILGNMKALLSTTLPDGMYYEVTYNKAKNEIYLDWTPTRSSRISASPSEMRKKPAGRPAGGGTLFLAAY